MGIWDQLSRKPETKPPLPSPVTGADLWNFTSLDGQEPEEQWKRRRDMEKRGFSVGDLRVGPSIFGLTLKTPKSIELTDWVKALTGAIDALNVRSLTVIPCREDKSIYVNIDDPALGIRYVNMSYGNEDPQRTFLCVHRFCSFPVEIETYSPEATQVALTAAKILGFDVTTAHYAHESDVPLSDIVVVARRWKDSKTGAHYVEICYRTDLVKHWVITGSCTRHSIMNADGIKIFVLGAHHGYPSLSINNREVRTSWCLRPTPTMIEARKVFRKRDQYTCAAEDCDRPAAHELTVNYTEVHDGFGSFGRGRILYACDRQDHVQAILDAHPNGGSEIRPYKETRW